MNGKKFLAFVLAFMMMVSAVTTGMNASANERSNATDSHADREAAKKYRVVFADFRAADAKDNGETFSLNYEYAYQIKEVSSPTFTIDEFPITDPQKTYLDSWIHGQGYIAEEEGRPEHLYGDYHFSGWYMDPESAYMCDREKAYPVSFNLDEYATRAADGVYEVILWSGWVCDYESYKPNVGDETRYYASDGDPLVFPFELCGVQVRTANIEDSFQDAGRDTTKDGIRFITSYSHEILSMLENIGGVKPRYGYVTAAKDRFMQTSAKYMKKGVDGVETVDCTKPEGSDRHVYSQYLLSALVIEYNSDHAQKNSHVDIAARAYVDYKDVQGFERTSYVWYMGNQEIGGGCYTSFAQAYEAIHGYNKGYPAQ